MLTNPDLIEIIRGDRGMLRGIQSCVESQCLVSAVSLMYAMIDALSALTREQNRAKTSRDIFKAWVARYLLTSHRLQCTPSDIYGARCGLIHTYSPESDLSQSGDAKVIIYKWRTGPPPDHTLPNVPPGALEFFVEDLWEGLNSAVDRFLKDVEQDQPLRERVHHHSRTLLCYRPWSPVEITVAA